MPRTKSTKGMTFKRILCPIDYDDNSRAALGFAARLARRYRGSIDLLNVVNVPFEPSEVPEQPDIPEWERDARRRLANFASENLGTSPRYRLFVRQGDPAEAILALAREVNADLIVMATHGHEGLAHLALGSVAESVVRESPVSVLTIRNGQAMRKDSTASPPGVSRSKRARAR
jgi:nucleotide-binding universal stress UspA family protein